MFDFTPADVMPRQIPRDETILALQQSQEFARALTATGQAPLVLEQLKNTVVLRRKLLGRFDAAMVTRANIDKPLRLIEVLSEQGLHRTPVILSPEQPTPALARHGAVPLVSPAHIGLLDLTGDPDQRRARLHQKWRNRLVHAERQGLRITRQSLPQNPAHWIFAADAAQQSARRYTGWPVELTLAYARENKSQAKIFEAHEGKEVVAGIVVLRHGRGATYHIAHTTARGRGLSAHNLLMWEVMTWLAKQGVARLDLGVINTEDAAGLARFKLGTGAQLHQLGGTWAYWGPMGRLLRPIAALDKKLMSGGLSSYS
ncbi:GNAT family N-acetyltransferase [Phaeobacter sp.]|uniref:GNAT family N-acetyltransferase n=1 Tax=Phaeobacter sp. TaxID=1902409 RepID=UPI0025CC8617|nr:GNAT family N-acetyltransferase [Phaeobacter sp.]